MFFSISIPIYNAEKRIKQCVDSILNQSFEDYEIVLVDDGSSDSSLSICTMLSEKYPEKIRVISKKNEGSLLTRKRCIQESKGEFLYIVDADDYICDKDALKKIHDVLLAYSADMCFFDYKIDNKEEYSFAFEDKTLFCDESLNTFYAEFLKNNRLNPLWIKVFHKSLVSMESDYTDYSDINFGTDFYQTVPLVCRARRVVYLKCVIYDYTFQNNNGSIVHKFNTNSYITAKKNYLRLEHYVSTYNWNVPDIEKILLEVKMSTIAMAAYKARFLKGDYKKKKAYFQSIASDDFFINSYSLRGIRPAKKVVVWLLKMKLYRVLAIII